MPKRNENKGKWKKLCPEDYKNAEQTDSDNPDDPEYKRQEQGSPKISQDKGCQRYRNRQEVKKGRPKRKTPGQTSTSTPKRIKGGQSSAVTPLSPTSQVSDTGTRRCNRTLSQRVNKLLWIKQKRCSNNNKRLIRLEGLSLFGK